MPQTALTGIIVIHGKEISWPLECIADFRVIDYGSEDFLRLKGIARARKMREWKLKRKTDIVAALKKWDQEMENTS